MASLSPPSPPPHCEIVCFMKSSMISIA
jgi:hypothetical protein